MSLDFLYVVVGFLLASYSVIANDSVQTLGTWIASNSKKFKWYYMWGAASSVLLFTIWYGWTVNGGDISYGRLDKIVENNKVLSDITNSDGNKVSKTFKKLPKYLSNGYQLLRLYLLKPLDSKDFQPSIR